MVWKRVSRGENYRNEIESIPIVYVYGISFELSTRSGGSRVSTFCAQALRS